MRHFLTCIKQLACLIVLSGTKKRTFPDNIRTKYRPEFSKKNTEGSPESKYDSSSQDKWKNQSLHDSKIEPLRD